MIHLNKNWLWQDNKKYFYKEIIIRIRVLMLIEMPKVIMIMTKVFRKIHLYLILEIINLRKQTQIYHIIIKNEWFYILFLFYR